MLFTIVQTDADLTKHDLDSILFSFWLLKEIIHQSGLSLHKATNSVQTTLTTKQIY